jgi:hypothetical protein
VTFSFLAVLLQISGCFWYVGSLFNLKTNENWPREDGNFNSKNHVIWIASIYWSVVTCTTVGYGDILPQNEYELYWALVIMIVGVATFSFVLGDLSGQFNALITNEKANGEKIK